MDKCEHPADVRSTDLASGDLFCGDCGDVIEIYRRQRGRLAGDEAATAIAGSLEGIGSVTVYGVTHIGDDRFDVGVRVLRPGSNDFRYFVVARSAGKLSVTERDYRG